MPVMIREAHEGDVAVLLAMLADFQPHEGIPYRAGRVERGLRELLATPALGFVLVAEAGEGGGGLAGYAVTSAGYDLEFGGRDAFITDLYIRADARRTGLGRALLAACEARGRVLGWNAVHLQVRPDNVSARQLYEAEGFAVVPRLLMTKVLVP